MPFPKGNFMGHALFSRCLLFVVGYPKTETRKNPLLVGKMTYPLLVGFFGRHCWCVAMLPGGAITLSPGALGTAVPGSGFLKGNSTAS